jgi:hypothetical protein
MKVIEQLSSSEVLTNREKNETVKEILPCTQNLCSTQLNLILSTEIIPLFSSWQIWEIFPT